MANFKNGHVGGQFKAEICYWSVTFLGQNHDFKFSYDASQLKASDNIMDRWIISFTQSLLLFIKQEMAGAFFFFFIYF